MAGDLLLDTNVVSKLLTRDETVLSYVRRFQGVFVPSVVIGELYFGIPRSTRIADNLSAWNMF